MPSTQERNPGCELDLGWVNSINVNLRATNELAKNIVASRELKGEYRAAWILKAITLIDLTTLGGDDTKSNVTRLCFKVLFNFLSIPYWDRASSAKRPLFLRSVLLFALLIILANYISPGCWIIVKAIVQKNNKKKK